MLTEAEALQTVLSSISSAPAESQPLLAAHGRYSAASVLATLAQPSFDNSAMDGYALHVEDCAAIQPLLVRGEQPAGPALPSLSVEHGVAVRIFTGAPLPANTAAVIMQEDVQRDGEHIRILDPVQPGENIRRMGSDLCLGQRILTPGDRINAARLGLLASQGITAVQVHSLPKVAVLSTGSELLPPGSQLGPGQLFESNSSMLAGLLSELGIHGPTLRHCVDDLQSTRQVLAELLADHQVVIISGGVSVGDHDHVRPALAALGHKPELWRVKIKPGKPFLYCRSNSTAVFGLPGNPVSSFVTYQLFVRPALLKLMGASHIAAQRSRATLAEPISNKGDRPHYLRGSLDSELRFRSTGLQASHAMYGLSQANALLRLDPEQHLDAGAEVIVTLL
jgi:molybdopterin molybdotransferase